MGTQWAEGPVYTLSLWTKQNLKCAIRCLISVNASDVHSFMVHWNINLDCIFYKGSQSFGTTTTQRLPSQVKHPTWKYITVSSSFRDTMWKQGICPLSYKPAITPSPLLDQNLKRPPKQYCRYLHFKDHSSSIRQLTTIFSGAIRNGNLNGGSDCKAHFPWIN